MTHAKLKAENMILKRTLQDAKYTLELALVKTDTASKLKKEMVGAIKLMNHAVNL